MKKLLGLLLAILSLFSCSKDLDRQVEFFSEQEHDPNIIGSWKKESEPLDNIVTVVDFLKNGHYRVNTGGFSITQRMGCCIY